MSCSTPFALKLRKAQRQGALSWVLNFRSRSREFGRKGHLLWRRLPPGALFWADGGVRLESEFFSDFERCGGSCFPHGGVDNNRY